MEGSNMMCYYYAKSMGIDLLYCVIQNKLLKVEDY